MYCSVRTTTTKKAKGSVLCFVFEMLLYVRVMCAGRRDSACLLSPFTFVWVPEMVLRCTFFYSLNQVSLQAAPKNILYSLHLRVGVWLLSYF